MDKRLSGSNIQTSQVIKSKSFKEIANSDAPVIRILTLDGGGIRGVGSAKIIADIEKKTGKPIYELFDVIVGTSTGGLLSIMCSIPTKHGCILPARKCIDLYRSNGKDIFTKEQDWMDYAFFPIIIIKKVWGLKYDHAGLKATMLKHFTEEMTMADSLVHSAVNSTDQFRLDSFLINSMRAKLYAHDYRHHIPVILAGMATTAAPTFFPEVTLTDSKPKEQRERSESVPALSKRPPKYLRDSIVLEDGATSNNNPTEKAIEYADVLFDHENVIPRFHIVSIGTGAFGEDEESFKIGSSNNIFETSRRLMNDPFLVARNGHNVHNRVRWKYGMEGRYKNSCYFRLQFQINEKQLENMDDVAIDNIAGLVKAAKHTCESETMSQVVRLLSIDCNRPLYNNRFGQTPEQIIETIKRTKLEHAFNLSAQLYKRPKFVSAFWREFPESISRLIHPEKPKFYLKSVASQKYLSVIKDPESGKETISLNIEKAKDGSQAWQFVHNSFFFGLFNAGFKLYALSERNRSPDQMMEFKKNSTINLTKDTESHLRAGWVAVPHSEKGYTLFNQNCAKYLMCGEKENDSVSLGFPEKEISNHELWVIEFE